MSWDITIQRFHRVYATVDEIPDHETCLALGSNAEVRDAISQAFPGTDWSDPSWGVFESAAGAIEFSIGTEEPNTGFMLHVRASEAIVPSIVALCDARKWHALDCSTGAFLERSAVPAAGLRSWDDYRRQVQDEAEGRR